MQVLSAPEILGREAGTANKDNVRGVVAMAIKTVLLEREKANLYAFLNSEPVGMENHNNIK